VALDALESRLAVHEWLAFDRPTIADIACFAYVENANEGNFDIAPYPSVVRWVARCKALPGWPAR
jgi:glutathione S-transferase